ncbi:MAG TPA: YoaK family protein [Vicinamibacterales bacterium]|jgi:uncharacterized membrane protein YoaK (UPF0700 family)|nr:YoaK family protein [Vicinamibacterales bacterium]
MPVNYVRGLTAPQRTVRANRHLACLLAFVAGATNAGGFVAIGQYTSHMSGIVSSMAGAVGLGHPALFLSGSAALGGFLAGSACTALLVNFGRRQHLRGAYAYPLLLEAALLLAFGGLGGFLQARHWLYVPLAAACLCFMMGLQNAIITKLSNAEIRTTHVTGMLTDIGIELGKLAYWNRSGVIDGGVVRADVTKLGVLTLLVGSFFAGGVAGAAGFAAMGFVLAIPLALVLLALTLVPAVDDARQFAERYAER